MDGLKFRVKSEELKAHLAKRAEYHRTRAADKTAELGPLKEAMERIKQSGNPVSSAAYLMNVSNFKGLSNRGTYNVDPDAPVEALEADIKNHASKGHRFAFMSEHLFDGDYTLTSLELVELEFVTH